MIPYKRYQLKNGLKLLVHQDDQVDIAAVNLMYNVGSRDEDPDITGLAHLFEHLMFEGSEHIPVFDRALEVAGGENNAFTNSDITNYYITLPAVNLETALWLESDRMKALKLTQEKLDIQKSVVIEEFKQRYLNQPYGDVWSLARMLSYKVHPYQWSTIGKDISHIEKVDLDIAYEFYSTFYAPDNAVLAIASPMKEEQVFQLVKKWFADIPPAPVHYERSLDREPEQEESRYQEVERDVPSAMIVKTYHMADRLSENYYIHDLISDILASGESSRLKQELVKNQELFTQIDAYISGDIDPGLLVISGKVNDETDIEKANQGIEEQINKMTSKEVPLEELQKAQNKALLRIEEEKAGVLEKAMNLSFYELLGDVELYERQINYYITITPRQLHTECKRIFAGNNQNTLFYKAKGLQ
ncbi:MAG: M16 family metallopeptidase [Bacteroidales bacterium]